MPRGKAQSHHRFHIGRSLVLFSISQVKKDIAHKQIHSPPVACTGAFQMFAMPLLRLQNPHLHSIRSILQGLR